MNNIYRDNKFIESIIYDICVEEKLRQRNLDDKLNLEFLRKLNKYLEIHKDAQTIDQNVKNRIYSLIRYIRFNMGQNKKIEYNEEINKSILTINQTTTEECLNFYYNQLNARAHDASTTSFDEKMKNLLRMYELMCYSICYDYKVLCDISKDPKEYEKDLKKYIANGWFLCSIKGINYENKEILEEPNIQENILTTIMQNEKQKRLDKKLKQSNQYIKQNILKR